MDHASRPLSMTFDEIADLYDSVRPSYPAQLVEAVELVLKSTEDRILEIGCGTGQATALFARQGYSVTALEPGANLAALAKSNLSAFPNVTVNISTFEEWPIQDKRYPMVLSATAFHWVAPEIRYVKAAQALADGGWLALFWNVTGHDASPLARQIQAVYDIHKPSNSESHPYATHHPSGSPSHRNTSISQWSQEIDGSGLFGEVSLMQFPWSEWYPTERYLQLLETYSDHRTMPQENKRRLFRGIADILARNGDGFNKQYLTVLYLAQKR